MNHKAKHFWDNLKDGDITNWQLTRITEGKSKCCCGTPIKRIMTLTHKTTLQEKEIGFNCGEKLGIKLSWKTKADYLANAYLFAKNNTEKLLKEILEMMK